MKLSRSIADVPYSFQARAARRGWRRLAVRAAQERSGERRGIRVTVEAVVADMAGSVRGTLEARISYFTARLLHKDASALSSSALTRSSRARSPRSERRTPDWQVVLRSPNLFEIEIELDALTGTVAHIDRTDTSTWPGRCGARPR